MDAWIHQASLWCTPCVEQATKGCLRTPSSFDGPYSNGGGEADCPQHCDACGQFLQNPLTPDGLRYVRERVDNARWYSNKAVLAAWRDFYCLEVA